MIILECATSIMILCAITLLVGLSISAIPLQEEQKDWLISSGNGFRFGVEGPPGASWWVKMGVAIHCGAGDPRF